MGEMTVREAGRLGGEKRKVDADYAAMGQKGGTVTRERHGAAHYAAIGLKGSRMTRARCGAAVSTEIGQEVGERVEELVIKGGESVNG